MAEHALVIGAQRCGTTFLADVLQAHPDVVLARPRRPEPKAFLREPPAYRAAYRAAHFGHAGGADLLVEKSTSYLERPEVIPPIRDVLGAPWVIVQLRDPVARAVSNWQFSTAHGVEQRSLEEAVRADLAGEQPFDRERFSVSPYAYARRGRYADDLAAWWDAFPGRVVVTFLEELAASPDAPAALYARLGLPKHAGPVPSVPVNASAGNPVVVPVGLEAELRAFYGDSDARLAELLGRELPWPRAGKER